MVAVVYKKRYSIKPGLGQLSPEPEFEFSPSE